LLRENEEEQIPTAMSAIVTVPRLEDGVSLLQFDDIPCPSCGLENVLVQSLEEKSMCPACGTGLVMKEGTCIY
jgi:uncharacterized Zn finger protein (UPF0148 family)